jgi:CRP/FNR family cyclic AMP-dependent transcriptional regulator
MSVRSDAEHFRRIPLFAESEQAHLQLLAFTSARETYDPGDLLVRAGEDGRAAFLILSGIADVWVEHDQNRKVIATVSAGAFTGEFAMIAGVPYPANVTATSEVTALRVGRDVFMRVVGEFPEFGIRVHRELAKRLDLSLADLNRLRSLFEELPSLAGRKLERR